MRVKHISNVTAVVAVHGPCAHLKYMDWGWEIADAKSSRRTGHRKGRKPVTWKTHRHLACRASS
jgi:hypothetical protein